MDEFAKVEYSRSQIEKAGKVISKSVGISDENVEYLKVIDNWRAAHAFPLQEISDLIEQVLGNQAGTLRVHRLKRLESIVGKLQRPNNTGLYRMQDLGGCRIIVPTVEEVYQTVERIKKKLEDEGHIIKNTYDYLFDPPEHSGYRSYHLVVQYQKDNDYNGMFVEIQVRTKLQHTWANLLEKIEKEKQSEEKHSSAFYTRYEELVRRFRLKVEKKTFPEKLDNWWRYEYEVRETGIVLSMCHIEYFDIHRDDVVSEFADTKFELLHIKTKLLTVEQYAQAYGVTTTTVRQWIRRGKIRSAMKMGSEWRIPELAENNARGYRGGCYCRNETLTDLPEEYAFFNDYDYVLIYQNEERKDLFDVCFGKDDDPVDNKGDNEMNQQDEKEIQMNQKEREKFELYLIGNPFVEATETCLAYRHMKQ